VLDGDSTQSDVYWRSGAQHAVCVDIFKGFNSTILAYGQTGAGKTFTMGSASGGGGGDGSILSEMDGIIPRACADLFDHIDRRCDGNAKVELSYLEIYNEEIRDLLVVDSNNGHKDELKIRETLNGEVYVSGLQSRPVSSPAEIGTVMDEASKRRVVASTKMNATSSRSHAICVLRIQGVLEDSTKFQSKLTLVDLAGSERIKKTGAEGGRRKEGININKGLFVLGQVVSALSEQRPKYKRKPPYRDSKLTRLLQDSLGGNSRTIMVACVSPADFNIDETINTLRYATSARNIKNTATRNVVNSISAEEAAKLQRDNQLLLAQVKEMQERIQKMALAEQTPSLASTVDSEEEDGSSLEDDDEVRSADKKRIRELEHELRVLKRSPEHKPPQVTASMAEDAIALPELHRKIAILEEELKAKAELEEENVALREEMEELKADAQSSRVAANKMSKIMDQLKELKGDEIDKKKMEHDHIKVEEAWVSFVFQVLESNREQMSRLRDDFNLVARVIESPDVLVPAKSTLLQKVFRKKNKDSDSDDGIPQMQVDSEMRQKLVEEHLEFFRERMIEMEEHVSSETESLASIRDSLRGQRDRLELEIGTSEFEREVLDKNDNDLLDQLTSLLIGPVKNLGEYE
jgi:Kinesin motor domain